MLFSIVAAPIYISTNTVDRFFFFPYYLQCLLCIDFLMITILIDVRQYLIQF